MANRFSQITPAQMPSLGGMGASGTGLTAAAKALDPEKKQNTIMGDLDERAEKVMKLLDLNALDRVDAFGKTYAVNDKEYLYGEVNKIKEQMVSIYDRAMSGDPTARRDFQFMLFDIKNRVTFGDLADINNNYKTYQALEEAKNKSIADGKSTDDYLFFDLEQQKLNLGATGGTYYKSGDKIGKTILQKKDIGQSVDVHEELSFLKDLKPTEAKGYEAIFTEKEYKEFEKNHPGSIVSRELLPSHLIKDTDRVLTPGVKDQKYYRVTYNNMFVGKDPNSGNLIYKKLEGEELTREHVRDALMANLKYTKIPQMIEDKVNYEYLQSGAKTEIIDGVETPVIKIGDVTYTLNNRKEEMLMQMVGDVSPLYAFSKVKEDVKQIQPKDNDALGWARLQWDRDKYTYEQATKAEKEKTGALNLHAPIVKPINSPLFTDSDGKPVEKVTFERLTDDAVFNKLNSAQLTALLTTTAKVFKKTYPQMKEMLNQLSFDRNYMYITEKENKGEKITPAEKAYKQAYDRSKVVGISQQTIIENLQKIGKKPGMEETYSLKYLYKDINTLSGTYSTIFGDKSPNYLSQSGGYSPYKSLLQGNTTVVKKELEAGLQYVFPQQANIPAVLIDSKKEGAAGQVMKAVLGTVNSLQKDQFKITDIETGQDLSDKQHLLTNLTSGSVTINDKGNMIIRSQITFTGPNEHDPKKTQDYKRSVEVEITNDLLGSDALNNIIQGLYKTGDAEDKKLADSLYMMRHLPKKTREFVETMPLSPTYNNPIPEVTVFTEEGPLSGIMKLGRDESGKYSLSFPNTESLFTLSNNGKAAITKADILSPKNQTVLSGLSPHEVYSVIMQKNLELQELLKQIENGRARKTSK